MNIYATVTFGNALALTQKWQLLEDEVCDDAEMRDLLVVMHTADEKRLVLVLDKQRKLHAKSSDGDIVCYLESLHIGNAKLL